ncbi:MAG: restriction endonuclease [Candidatus Moraniibacteriota bacterium]
MNKEIKKTTGEKEEFSASKLQRSLERAGIDSERAKAVAKEISKESNLDTTVKIHRSAYNKLKTRNAPTAARYNLKRALKMLGPSGYPFEQFVARLLDARGYKTSTNRTLRGSCITHEIDVMAYRDNRHFIFECKFHNKLGYKSDVQTVLYMKARFDDIKKRWDGIHEGRDKHLHKLWLVTNTQFTSQAVDYARCAGIELMSWRYPHGKSLAELIDKTGLHPITAITKLSKRQKDTILSKGLILCREVEYKKDILEHAGVRGRKLEQIVAEAKAIVDLKNET